MRVRQAFDRDRSMRIQEKRAHRPSFCRIRSDSRHDRPTIFDEIRAFGPDFKENSRSIETKTAILEDSWPSDENQPDAAASNPAKAERKSDGTPLRRLRRDLKSTCTGEPIDRLSNPLSVYSMNTRARARRGAGRWPRGPSSAVGGPVLRTGLRAHAHAGAHRLTE